MGYRLHYATPYRVKYDGGYFNHKTEINELLVDKCDASYNEITPECSDRLEIEREDLVKLVQEIKNNPKEYEDYLTSKGWDYTLEDFVEIFNELIAKSDQSNSYIVLRWF